MRSVRLAGDLNAAADEQTASGQNAAGGQSDSRNDQSVSAGEQNASVSVHGTAYTLGAFALLKTRGHDLFSEVLAPESWALDQLIDGDSRLPRWPAKWSHHTWRVSHWVGGSLAILHELWRQMPKACEASGVPAVDDVLQAVDGLIDGQTGMLRCYHSRWLQLAFRQAYRLRHDPLLGDIGGVVHVHWVNYAHNRPFKAGGPLFDAARAVMLERWPFMEQVPYCLDFDVVQIVRASMPSNLPRADQGALQTRASSYALDIKRFLEDNLNPDYALHKLPGALATLHECILINPSIKLHDLGLPSTNGQTKDIMQDVAWL